MEIIRYERIGKEFAGQQVQEQEKYKPGKCLDCLPELKTLAEWAVESRQDKIIVFNNPFNITGYLLEEELPYIDTYKYKAMKDKSNELFFKTEFTQSNRNCDEKKKIDKEILYLTRYNFNYIDIYKMDTSDGFKLKSLNSTNMILSKPSMAGVKIHLLKEAIEEKGVASSISRNRSLIETAMFKVAEESSNFPGQFKCFTEVEFDQFGEIPNGLVTVYLAQKHKELGYIAVYAAYIEPVYCEDYTGSSIEFTIL